MCTEVLGENPVPMLICPSPMLPELHSDRNRIINFQYSSRYSSVKTTSMFTLGSFDNIRSMLIRMLSRLCDVNRNGSGLKEGAI